MRNRCLGLALAAGVFASASHAALCTSDPVPAASLLLPWFEVGDCDAPGSQATSFTLTNTGSAARLAHVTLWTNAAVPAFDFDVYLNGFAQQEVDLHALFCNGTLPQTGRGLATRGQLAGPEVSFTGCNDGTSPANGAPVYAPLDGIARAQLQAAFGGLPGAGGMCSSLPPPMPGAAPYHGYVTVDAVDRCNADVAGQPGFAVALQDDNVLSGRVSVFDAANNVSFAYAAVALEAAGNGELAASPSFYDPAPGGADAREPLATTWGVDFSPVGNTQSSLIVWRGVGSVGAAFACNAKPAWYPLDFSNRSGYASRGAFVVDDDAHAAILQRSPPLAPNATQRVFPFSLADLGYVRLNLQHSRLPGAAVGGQGWMMRVDLAEGRYASEEVATSFDSSCSGAAFDNVSPGPGGPL
jgi:hypothetical protein